MTGRSTRWSARRWPTSFTTRQGPCASCAMMFQGRRGAVPSTFWRGVRRSERILLDVSWYARIVDASAPAERHIIDTASGVRLDLDHPRSEDIRIEDVAGGLSKVCRFGAQALEYYSVAQHALLVRRLVEEGGYPELALAALHHDSHEAYLCDIPSPLKSKICT